MKAKLKIPKFALPALIALAFLAGQSAQAQIINVQLGENRDAAQDYTGTGVDPNDTGTNWNAVAGTPTTISMPTLLDQNGNSIASGPSFSAAGDSTYSGGSFSATDPSGLTNTWLIESGGGTGTFSFASLPDNVNFTLYLYGTNSGYGGRPTQFTVDGSSVSSDGFNGIASSGTYTTFVAGNNYVTFTGNTGASGTITGTFTGVNGNDQASINGLQLDLTPEPSTYALLLGGVVTLVALQRRNARKV